MTLRSPAARGLVAGLLVTASLPPFGWWPLGIAGLASLERAIAGRPAGHRAVAGAATGVGLFAPGLWWMTEFTVPGYVVAVVGETALFWVPAVVLVPPDRRRWFALPFALTLAEAVRGRWPFGGVPLATVAMGQAGGPLAEVARVGTALAVTAATVAVAVAIGAAMERRWRPAGAAAAVVLGAVALGSLAPDGNRTSEVAVAAVQGGGERGTRAVDTDERLVFRRHARAARAVTTPVDLVLWPEDVVDVARLEGSDQGALLGRMAAELDATVVAGVVEDAPGGGFRNLAVAWGPDGHVVDTYLKVRRVPFGEFVPFRGLVGLVADLSLVPRDAEPGEGPGFLETPTAPLAVAVSWEVFFTDRVLSGVRAGGELVAAPTNTASYSTSQVPTQQLAAARLRAIEAGRWLVLAGPTGFSAVVDEDGTVLARSDLGARRVLQRPVERRVGTTWAVAGGELVPGALSAAAVVLVRVGPGGGPIRLRRRWWVRARAARFTPRPGPFTPRGAQ